MMDESDDSTSNRSLAGCPLRGRTSTKMTPTSGTLRRIFSMTILPKKPVAPVNKMFLPYEQH
jgi:hypothetical protein